MTKARRPNEVALMRIWDILCLPAVDLDTTVKEARKQILSGMTIENDQGIHNHCPCCGENNTAYRISMRRDYAVALIRMVEYHLEAVKSVPDDPELHYIDLPTFLKRWEISQRDQTKMKRWGLLMPHPTHSGMWIPTKEGVGFALGHFKIPKWVCSFHDFVVGYTGEWLSIEDVLGMPSGWSFETHVRAGAEALELEPDQRAGLELIKGHHDSIEVDPTAWADLYDYLYDADLVEKVPQELIQPGPSVQNDTGLPLALDNSSAEKVTAKEQDEEQDEKPMGRQLSLPNVNGKG